MLLSRTAGLAQLPWLSALLLISCTNGQPPATVDQSADPTVVLSPSPRAAAPDRPVAAPPPETLVSTQTFTPTPIQIELADLPEPFATDSATQGPQVIAVPDAPQLEVPPGFTVNVFADGLNSPRWLALSPEGDVLVTETPVNQIRRLRDTNGDGVADDQSIFADRQQGLNRPFGMTFSDDAFFLGNADEVRRYDYQAGQGSLADRGEQLAELPSGGHWTRNVLLTPDGESLWVAIGSRSNVTPEPLPRASIQQLSVNGGELETVAWGLRNPVGLALHPVTQDLYTTVNERDGLGDDLVPDYLTKVETGAFYGWPYVYLAPTQTDPRLAAGDRTSAPEQVAATRSPEVLFQAHSAALGLTFYTGETFPERYRNGAFVAFRGSWNRQVGTGYKIVFVPFDDAGNPTGGYEDFVRGFLVDPNGPTTWGRPVSVLSLPDGSLLFTDEANGRIYRVQYAGANEAS